MQTHKQPRLTHPTAQNGGENLFLAGILHFSEGQNVEVTCEALGDGVPTSTGGPMAQAKLMSTMCLNVPDEKEQGDKREAQSNEMFLISKRKSQFMY